MYVFSILTDINDLNLPKTCTTDFPDSDDLLNFKLIIMPDEGFYKGGRFVFNFKVSAYSTTNIIQLLHIRVHLLHFFNNIHYYLYLGWTELSAWTTESEMRNIGLSPEHRPRRQRLLEYFAWRLEACFSYKCNCLWLTIFVPGKCCSLCETSTPTHTLNHLHCCF